MLCFILGNENSNAGHIRCSRGQQVPYPALTEWEIQLFKPITLCASVRQTVSLGPITSRAAPFIGERTLIVVCRGV